MKVAVVGEIYSANLGDHAIYASMRQLLDARGVESVPLDLSGRDGFPADAPSPPAERTGRLKDWLRPLVRKSVSIRRLLNIFIWSWKGVASRRKKWEGIISSVDAVVIGGGQLLTDLDFGFPPKVFLVTGIARRLGKPVAIFGCGVGEWGLLARLLYRRSLKNVCFVSVRDDFSRDLLVREISPAGGVRSHPDPAFTISELFPDYPKPAPGTLGINVQPPAHFRRFVPELSKLSDEDFLCFWVNSIRKLQSRYSIAIQVNGAPADYDFATQIQSRLAAMRCPVKLFPRPTSLAELVCQISSSEKLVCTRMHAGIIGYSLGVNVRPLSWDRKVSDVWERAGASETVVSPLVIRRGELPLETLNVPAEDGRKAHLLEINEAMDLCVAAIRSATKVPLA